MKDRHSEFMRRAYELARKSYEEGGCPIGAVLVDNLTKRVLGEGYNRLVQEGSPILHGEMDALRKAGRMPSRRHTTLYTSLSPCMMCAGAIVQFNIPRVVMGYKTESSAESLSLLQKHGIELIDREDPESRTLYGTFRRERPELDLEDWGGPRRVSPEKE